MFSGLIEFSDDTAQKIQENIDEFYTIDDDSDLLSGILKHIQNKKDDEKKILSQYKYNLEENISILIKAKEAAQKNLENLNIKMLGVIKRLRSDEYIYASVVLQKVMITMLIVSIGLYFLKAIGADLLFLRKLTIVNLSQSIANGDSQASPESSILVYNAIAGEEEKKGKAPETIPMKTLGEIAKILSKHGK